MPDIKLKTRIQNKYKTLNEWNLLAEGEFIPLVGEVCYAVDNDILYQKIGDGVTDFTKLPWLNNITPQPDHDENDETSLSYIKNRLAYTKIEEILPENQEIGYYEYPNDQKVNIAIYSFEEDAGIDPEVLGFPADATHYVQCEPSQPYFFNNVNILNEILDLKNEFTVILKDKDNQYEFLLDPLNIATIKDSGMIGNLFLVGNPIAANILLQEMLDLPGSFSEDKNTNLDYVLLLMTIENYPDYPNEIMSQTIFVGNTKSFLLNDADSCIISINHTKQEVVHKIDEKYLPEIEQSDLNELDSSKQSYIKNKIGDQITGFFAEEYDYEEDYFNASYTIRKYTAETGAVALSNGVINHTFPTYLISPNYIGYNVTINGTTYYYCPSKQVTQLFGQGDTIQIIGNFSYPLKGYESGLVQGEIVTKGSNFADNGIPISLTMNWNNANPIAELRVSKETYDSWGGASTIEITITRSEMTMFSTVIPRYWLPSDIKNTLWAFDLNKNSICSNTATGANGINSVAIGPLAKVISYSSSVNEQGIAAMAIGNEVIAYGNSSLAVNYKTEAADAYAFASGNKTKASGVASASFNSNTQAWGNAAIATGSNTIAGGFASAAFGASTKTENNANYSFVGGLGSISSGIGNFVFGEYPLVNSQYGITVASFGDSVELTVERPRENGTEITFASLDDIPTIFKSEYTLYWKFINETYYRRLSYSIYDNGLTFHLHHASEPIDVAWNKIIIAAQPKTDGIGAVNIGQSNLVSGDTTIALGKGLIVQADNQFVIGKYNEINDNNIFAIGNGTGYTSRSNAFAIDTNGNVSAAGSIETTSVILSSPSGIKFKVTVDDSGILTSTEITE